MKPAMLTNLTEAQTQFIALLTDYNVPNRAQEIEKILSVADKNLKGENFFTIFSQKKSRHAMAGSINAIFRRTVG